MKALLLLLLLGACTSPTEPCDPKDVNNGGTGWVPMYTSDSTLVGYYAYCTEGL